MGGRRDVYKGRDEEGWWLIGVLMIWCSNVKWAEHKRNHVLYIF